MGAPAGLGRSGLVLHLGMTEEPLLFSHPKTRKTGRKSWHNQGDVSEQCPAHPAQQVGEGRVAGGGAKVRGRGGGTNGWAVNDGDARGGAGGRDEGVNGERLVAGEGRANGADE